MPEPMNDSPVLLRPTAWSIGIVSATSAGLLVLCAAVGAVVTFAGGTIMLFRDLSSDIFMGFLIATAIVAGVTMILVAVQCVREARREYTTIANAYPRLEWRDHKTGLVFRKAGAATPRGSIANLRERAARGEIEPDEP